MNGGKDVKIGHDKRPVSVIPSDEQPLYNIANGEILTDEFGNPLVTKVDQFFLADASKDRSTSIVFPENPKDKYSIKKVTQVGTVTATYGVDFDVDVAINSNQKITVLKRTGAAVLVGVTTIKERVESPSVAIGITFTDFNQCEIRTIDPDVGSFNDKNNLYFSNPSDIKNVGFGVSFNISGHNIPDGSHVIRKDFDRIKMSQPVTAGVTTDKIIISRTDSLFYQADNVLKVAEEFVETSEVSTTLLGVNRAETQLSLFSNVSSYGLNDDEWESFSYNTGSSKGSWDGRPNKIYGNRYLARIEEETQESAIKLSAFPPSHSYPFGPNYAKLNLYDKPLFEQYENFVRLGNLAYDLFKNKLSASNYPSSWTSRFLNPSDVKIDENGDIFYAKLQGKENDFAYAFQKIDEWTDTWRAIGEGKSLLDPITGNFLSFGSLKILLADNDLQSIYDGTNTRPGYYTNYRRYSTIQSRRVFRYQPGRISGFTFGLRSSTEPVSGIALEWGIKNETDEYVFKIYAGQLSIVRRSTVPLSRSVLIRNGLDPSEISSVQINGTSYNTVQPEIPSGDPFAVNDDGGPLGDDEDTRARKFHTIEIPRDKFNGDPLNGNGPSGYTIRPEKVTMWKIEFGWYGAIGARFYAYIPAGNGDARWVVIHTLVIENSLTGPCLRDSYFRFKYSLDVFNTANLKTPQFLYKYGASYYIDGGDEGTSEIYSVSTGLNPKQISTANETSLFAIRPKDVITNSSGVSISNRKLIIPTNFNITTNTLAEIKVKNCRACAGFGHVFTPGVKTGENGRNMTIKFEGENLITAVGVGASFTEADIGAKLIAPSIFGVYITEMDEGTATSYSNGFKTYESAKVYGYGPGLDNYPKYNDSGGVTGRPIAGAKVKDYAQGGIATQIQIADPSATPPIDGVYPHTVRISNYDVHFASDYEINGAEIDIQFINPVNKDQSSLGGSATHFADFMIGVTDKKPSIDPGNSNVLLGWNIPWIDYSNLDSTENPPVTGINTSVLPEREILFGESTHSFVNMDEDQVETKEAWSGGNYRCRMGQDVRIPVVSSTSGGNCSIMKIQVSDPIDIAVSVNEEYRTDGKTPDGLAASDTIPRYYLTVEGGFGGDITDWLGGQIVYRNEDGSINQNSNAKYAQNEPVFYTVSGVGYEYIEIDQSVGATNITIVGRPVQLKASRLNVPSKNKLFQYDVYPLYLVGKLMDRAQINNISIKEKTGTFQKTTAPILSSTIGVSGIDVAFDGTSNNTFNDATPPTNFVSVDRLSSSTVDTQNEQILRPSTTKDIFYVGQNETKEIDMSKVFGVDRNVITPDNNNIEATFFTAKQLETGSSKFVQGSLNYKEQ